ncbi:secondary thiamine-phosphate synthase enzyme YjbQ [Hippea alviniae]|uniref:secondary thiamine-phosphate synthase enzyme YjbQ n=1 Tax=Hippea alviniae TaxID=1279027 RepID=UPI0003B4ABA8|nr:secondary thiamine-phosphate synthase enzyme YjbQ [Hippea alviniae]
MIRKSIRTSTRKEAIEITSMVEEEIKGIKNGIAIIYVPHTTAGVIINEAFDPAVAEDILNELSRLIPYSDKYKHLEGNADAHIQATLTGSSVMIPIESGRLLLGRWQGVFFMEFDGPRNREFYIKVIKE